MAARPATAPADLADRSAPRRRAATTSFGVGRREGRDASGFYDRFTAPNLSDAAAVGRATAFDTVWVGDARDLDMLHDVFAQCFTKFEPGGRIAVNVAGLGRKPHRSLTADVIGLLEGLGYLLRWEIVWQESHAAGGSCALGTCQRPGNPVLRDVAEQALVDAGFTDPGRSDLGPLVPLDPTSGGRLAALGAGTGR